MAVTNASNAYNSGQLITKLAPSGGSAQYAPVQGVYPAPISALSFPPSIDIPKDMKALQERLDKRRARAEQEIIAVAELQALLNALPEGTTPSTLSRLVNL